MRTLPDTGQRPGGDYITMHASKPAARMRAAGFNTAALDRIHAPVGLAIGAKSPPEIAVAILGEIIGAMHQSQTSESERAA